MGSPEYNKRWRAENKDARRAYNKKYQTEYDKRHPERRMLWQIKTRAKKQGVPFDLTLEDMVVPEDCPILGIPLCRNLGRRGPSGSSPSVDKIDPTKGYVKGNIQIISQRANVMKNDASREELQRFADWILKTFPR